MPPQPRDGRRGADFAGAGEGQGIIEGKQALKNISAEKAEVIRAELKKLGTVIRIGANEEDPEKNGRITIPKGGLQPGQHIVFGRYPQTAEGNDSTPIEWRVLDVQGDKALVISEYGLDAKPYNMVYTDVTWETCTLRKWLNSDFLSAAFDSRTQNAILTTSVDNSKSQHYDWTQQSWVMDSTTYTDYADTQDKIFLLSYAEAMKYFATDEERSCAPTEYAMKQGAYHSDSNSIAEYRFKATPHKIET